MAPKTAAFNIIERANVFDDNLLDIIGREFKFDHEKGLAEWLKNSIDAYLRMGIADSDQYVVLRFTDGKKDDATLECVDFVGMTQKDIEKAFIRWGDPEAAKRGLKKRMYGGHGNGGKFYMRQMFDKSHFVTYREGYLNIFGFNGNKKYGFAENFNNKKIKPEEALKFAGIDSIALPGELKKKILKGNTGFTVVKGFGPANMKNKIKVARIAEKLKNHPQARRLLLRKRVSLICNGSVLFDLLRPDEIKPLNGFEEPLTLEIPKNLVIEREGEKNTIELASKKFEQGRLVLRTSEEALQTGRYADLNRIDFIGEVGDNDKTVIASYELSELGVRTFPQAAFIFGECSCPILEDLANDCVSNDRTKLVQNDLTRALLNWVRGRIEELADKIVKLEAQEHQDEAKKISSVYNEYLNQWKNRWMRKIFSDMFERGSGNEGGGGTGKGGKWGKLQIPKKGFEFRFSEAKIPVNEAYPLTLKALVPEPIPIGSIITVLSGNPLIELDENKVTIRADFVKLTEDGEEVAVININVTGKKVGEETVIIAKTGKFEAEIKIIVVESETGGGSKKSKYPKVLLSGHDPDPLEIDTTVTLSPRHNLVYQRFEDVREGIYWINTQSPLALSILKRGGVESSRWRDYLFQRYIEIFMKEALYELQKREPEAFRAERIDNDVLGELVKKVHAAAAEDLDQFLFNEEYSLDSSETEKKE